MTQATDYIKNMSKSFATQAYGAAKVAFKKTTMFTSFKVQAVTINPYNFSFDSSAEGFGFSSLFGTVEIKDSFSHYGLDAINQAAGFLQSRIGLSDQAASSVAEFMLPLVVVDGFIAISEHLVSYTSDSIDLYFEGGVVSVFTGDQQQKSDIIKSLDKNMGANSGIQDMIYHIENSDEVPSEHSLRELYNSYSLSLLIWKIVKSLAGIVIAGLNELTKEAFKTYTASFFESKAMSNCSQFFVELCKKVIPGVLLLVTVFFACSVYVLYSIWRVKTVLDADWSIDSISAETEGGAINRCCKLESKLRKIKSKLELSKEVIDGIDKDLMKLRQLKTLIKYYHSNNKEAFLNDVRENQAQHMVPAILWLKATQGVEIAVDNINIKEYVESVTTKIDKRHSNVANIVYKQLIGLLKDILWVFIDLVPTPGSIVVFSVVFSVITFVALPNTTVCLLASMLLLTPVINWVNSLFKAVAHSVYLNQAFVWIRATFKLDLLFSIGSVNQFDIKKRDGKAWEANEWDIAFAKIQACIISDGKGADCLKINSDLYAYKGPADLKCI